jgi:hypothetical protein
MPLVRVVRAFSVFAVLVLGCAHGVSQQGDAPVPPENEVAMEPETTIDAFPGLGPIRITAGKGLNRCYAWEGDTRCIELWPRTRRWRGSLGLYHPAPGDPWAPHNGISRGVVEEGQQHFDTVEEALAWLSDMRKIRSRVYRNDGLVVAWQKAPDRRQINVEVWRITINGVYPTRLEGADDAKIIVTAHRGR